MKFEFKRVSRRLEDALAIAAFEMSLDGERRGVVLSTDTLTELLDDLEHTSGVDLRTDAESAEAVTDLSHQLCQGWGDIATRVRDHVVDPDAVQPGYGWTTCSQCGSSGHGNIKTPFGARQVTNFADAFRVTSTACQAGLPIQTGVSILRAALVAGITLNEPIEDAGFGGMEFGSIVISVGPVRRTH